MKLRPIFIILVFALLSCGARPTHAQGIAGNWIWTSGESSPRNAYAYFRKSFSISAVPESATIRVTADSRYILYVNGIEVRRGPSRSHTRYRTYDTIDAAAYFQRGANVIAAVVHHYGDWTFSAQRGRAGLLVDARIVTSRGSYTIRTDDSWRALRTTAWDADLDRINMQLGFPELYDARKEPVNWISTVFDDSSWGSAVVIGSAGTAPWTNLTANPLPDSAESVLRPKSVVVAQSVGRLPSASRISFAPLYDRQGWSVAYAETALYSPTARDVTLQLGSDDAVKLWVNGSLALDRCIERLAAPAQDTVRIHLYAGWNPVRVKVVQMLNAWEMYFGIASADASGIVISVEQNISKPGWWRVSDGYAFDGNLGVVEGFNRAYPPETGGTVIWRPYYAPVEPLRHVASVIRIEPRTPGPTARVLYPERLTQAVGGAVFQSLDQADGSVVLDMGRDVLGYVSLSVTGANDGTVLDLGYAETLEDASGNAVSPLSATGVVNPQRASLNMADRFICKAGSNTFETFEKRGFRYVQLDVRNASQPLTVKSLTVRESLYPVTQTGAFECSDERLNRIWQAGRLTLRLNMDDAYTDCPWRERAQWWGDARTGALVNYYAFGDRTLIARGLVQASESQDVEGIVKGVFPTDWTGDRLPSYSLLWIISLWEYYLHTGDISVPGQMLPVIAKVFQFAQTHTNTATGLLENVPYWVFIDWAPGMDGQRIGVSGSLNCFYYRALLAASDIAKSAGDTAASALYANRAEAVKSAVNARLWDAQRGLYRDSLAVPNRYSRHVNTLAVLYGIAPAASRSDILTRMFRYPDVVPFGTPYFSSFHLEALYAVGRHSEALNLIRTQWGAMLDWGTPTFWEKWTPTDSLCHAWSTGPTRDLQAQWLGLTPTAPGWSEWRLSPVINDLTWAKGAVPTPKGTISASWTRGSNNLRMVFNVPANTVGHVRIPIAGLKNARWYFGGAAKLPAGASLETESGYLSFRLTQAGSYDLLVRFASAVRPIEDTADNRLLHSSPAPAGAVSP